MRAENPAGKGAGRKLGDIYLRPDRLLGRGGLALLAMALAVLVQATLVARVRFLGVSPNLLLVAVVAWSLLQGVAAGVIWGFIGGLGLDLITGMPLGTSSLALMTACLLAGLGRNRIFASNLWWPIFIVVLATPTYGWVISLTQQIRGVPVSWIATTTRVIGPELLLNVVLMALVYPALRWLTAHSRYR